MGERVNIQYSVDMDDLPSEIVRLVARAIADLNDGHNQSHKWLCYL